MQKSTSLKIVILALGVTLVAGCDKKDDERSDSGGSDTHILKHILSISQSQKAFQPDEFESAVRAYASGDLVADNGVVSLPDDWAGTTVDGRMYVTVNPSYGTLYLFRTWRGKGSNLRGYLYQPPQQDEAPDQEALVGRIEVLGFRVPGPTVGDPPYGMIEIDIEDSLGRGWYKVKRDLD